MSKQPAPGARSRKRLVAALVAVLVAAAAFAAAFYALDGMALLEEYASPMLSWIGLNAPDEQAGPEPSPGRDRLILPEGMPQDFALRLWQEQVESQANLERLAEGDVKSMRVTSTARKGDSATLEIEVEFADGASAPGELGMRRFGKAWYVSWVRGVRSGVTPVSEAEKGHTLPSIQDVDVRLLSALVASQARSQALLSDYSDGAIERVDVTSAAQTDDGSTLALKITDSDGEEYAGELVLVKGEAATMPAWFVARFSRTDAK